MAASGTRCSRGPSCTRHRRPPRPLCAQVQDEAVHTMSLLVQLGTAPQRQQLQGVFEAWCRAKVPKGASATAPEVVFSLGGCLGLVAIARAFPHTVPDFIPGILCLLAKYGAGVEARGLEVMVGTRWRESGSAEVGAGAVWKSGYC